MSILVLAISGCLQYNQISIDGCLRPTSQRVSVNNSEYDQFRNISSNNHFSNQAAVMKVQSQSQISVSDKIDDFFAELSQQVINMTLCLVRLKIIFCVDAFVRPAKVKIAQFV